MLKKSASLSSARRAGLARQAQLASPDSECLAFLASLACLARLSCGGVLFLSQTSRPSKFYCAEMVFPQPASLRADALSGEIPLLIVNLRRCLRRQRPIGGESWH